MTTQLTEKPEATRNSDVLGVHSIDHFALTVPDLAEAKAFYSAFGLDVRETATGLELYAFGNPHRWAVLRQGPRKHLDYMSFGIYEEDMPRFRQRLAEIGADLIDAPAGVESNGIWFRNLDGMPMELRVGPKVSPSNKSVVESLSSGPGECAAIARSKAPRAYPRTLSHFLLFSSDVTRDVEFYGKALGIKFADGAAGIVAFMYSPHGSDHHLLALAKSDGPGMHHHSWEMGSVHEVGLAAEYMRTQGYTEGWGLGRHVLGANYFNYVRDPWGSYAEYSCDIDFIPAGHEWPSADHPPEDSLYLWGPSVPETFIVNYETQGA